MLEANLQKKLRDFPLDLKIQVNPGEILVLMGENGAGKSTLLNIISGLLIPDKGSIRLDSRDLYEPDTGIIVPAENRNIGYVFQKSVMFPHLSVFENIAYGLKARHLQKSLIIQQANLWMDLMDIQNLANVKAGKLSGGQKQRVSLARALAIEPDLLLLDEPFTALDADAVKTVKSLLRTYIHDQNIPCILVTHRIPDTKDIGNAVCTISRGNVRWQGQPGEIPDSIHNMTEFSVDSSRKSGFN